MQQNRFRLPLPDAAQLETAMERTGWTAEDLTNLHDYHNLLRVLHFLRSGCEASIPPGMQLVPKQTLTVSRSEAEWEALKATSLGDVFTHDLTIKIGFEGQVCSRFLDRVWRRQNVHTVSDLLQRSEADLMDMPGVGKTILRYVKTYLGELGLELAASLRTPRQSRGRGY